MLLEKLDRGGQAYSVLSSKTQPKFVNLLGCMN
jgi:hypothetical protein